MAPRIPLSVLGPAALRQIDAILLAEQVAKQVKAEVEARRGCGPKGELGRNKYGARRTQVDGIWFDSDAESRRYAALKLLERAGEIRDLILQPAFDLHALGGGRVGQYRADFAYTRSADGVQVVEDVKSKPTITALYRWKKRHMQAEHNIEIIEVME